MKKIIALFLILSLCLSFAACGGEQNNDQTQEQTTQTTAPALTELTAPADSNVIASAVTGSVVTQVTTIDELTDAVDSTGNTQITLWQDITDTDPIWIPYSCTLDLNGFTIATSPEHGGGIQIDEAGSENKITVIKNGTLTQYGNGIAVIEGGLQVENMDIRCIGGAPVCIYDPDPAYLDINRVTGSTLSTQGVCVSFYFEESTVEYPVTGMTLEKSTLISYDPEGANMFANYGSGANVGMMLLGQELELYSYGDALATEGFYYGGSIANREQQTVSVSVGDATYENINHWSTQQRDDVIDLLMIGNSFCYYYVQELYGIAEAAGVQINVTNLYEAGCNVSEHWTWLSSEAAGKDKYAFWITNSMGRWKHGQIRTSYEALDYMDWDVISLQQHFKPSVAVSYEAAINSCVPYTENLFSYLKENHPDAKLYWHETWAYQVGHENIPDQATQANQQENIIKASQTICQNNGVDMIPSGEAWVIARKDPKVGDGLCKSDMYHDGDLGGGQYLNACVWFEVLTGKSCVGNTWRPDYILREEKITQLQLAAHQAVADLYGEDYAK